MEHSFFFDKRCGPARSFPISYLFLESLRAHVDSDSEVLLQDAISRAAADCFNRMPTAEQLQYVADKLRELNGKVSDACDSQKEPPLTLGTSLTKWLNGIKAERLCYLLANFDPVLAEKLYCDTDYAVVADMAALYAERAMQDLNSAMEAAMYGFGGKYKDDRGGGGDDGNVIDLVKNKEAGLKQLKAMGF